MTIKTLFDFKGPLETISFSDLAVALGCDESTIKIWLKDETIKMPKPLQIGDNRLFSYKEVKNWLQSRPKFNCFYDINQDKIEILDNRKDPVEIDGLRNEKIALETLQRVFTDFREETKFLENYYEYIQQYLSDSQQDNKVFSSRTGIIMTCIVIDKEIKLVNISIKMPTIEHEFLLKETLNATNKFCEQDHVKNKPFNLKNNI